MGTYSNNTTVKVNAAVSATSSATSGTLYTAPANGYAIVQGHFLPNATPGNNDILIGGRLVYRWNVTSSPAYQQSTAVQNSAAMTAGASFGPFHVGPGQAVTFSKAWTSALTLTGVEFLNTP